MNIRKVLAGSLAAITAGATLAFAAFGATTEATGLGTYFTASATPWIVVGGSAAHAPTQYPADVAGAGDIAAAGAGYKTTDVAVSGASVGLTDDTNNALLATSSTKLYYADRTNKTNTNTVLTSAKLPSLLGSEKVTDDAGTDYTYEQYIEMGNKAQITLSDSEDQFSDPQVHLAIEDGTVSASNFLYKYFLSFNKPLNISNEDVQNNKLNILGVDYTIGTGSSLSGLSLELFGSAYPVTLSESESKTVTVEGEEVTVSLPFVTDENTLAITINGVTESMDQGQSKKVGGVEVYIDTVLFNPKTGGISQAKINLGSAKMTFENGTYVKVGSSQDSVDGTFVEIINDTDGISQMTVYVLPNNDDNNAVYEDMPYVDPVFGNFQIAYGGMQGGATEDLVLDNSGNTGATLKFTDYRGNERTITWAYSSSSSWAPVLNASSSNEWHVVEGESVKDDDYFVLAPSQESDFGHIYQLSNINTGSNPYIEIKDVMANTDRKIYLTKNGNRGAEFYIDGQKYYANVTGSTVKFTWGDATATYGVVGAKTTAFPLVRTSLGAWIAPVEQITGVVNNTVFELPGGDLRFDNTSTTATVGNVVYNTTGSTLRPAPLVEGYPGILFYEEKADDISGTERKDAITINVKNAGSSASSAEMGIYEPSAAASTGPDGYETFGQALESDTSMTHSITRRGTVLMYDSDSQGKLTITYSDEQSEAAVAVGEDPVFSTTGSSTVKSAVKITSPLTKLDTEINTATLDADLILLGGPVANTLVKTLVESGKLEVEGHTLLPGEWTPTTGIIKEVEDAFVTGKKALVIAGTTGADTRNLAAKVMTGTLDFAQ